MKIKYISHAGLLIETDNIRVLMDPWFDGPAYLNQWHLFPKPLVADIENVKQNIDYIFISHGHEDHLHDQTLKQLPKNAKIYYPYQWYETIKTYFQSLGYYKIKEAINFKKYKISNDTYVTFILHNLDSIIVVESRGKILVNLNDALHHHNKKTIEYYCSLIKSNWNEIDYIFCGYGGASYFPNTIKTPSKNDEEIALVREQFFVLNNFIITNHLNPKYSIPFAADYVLLDPEHIWINETKTKKSAMVRKYHEMYPEKANKIKMKKMYPGDILEDYKFIKNSKINHDIDNGLDNLYLEEYKEEINRKKNPEIIPSNDALELKNEIINQISNRLFIFARLFDHLEQFSFNIYLKDLKSKPYFNIIIKPGNIIINTFNTQPEDVICTIKTDSKNLRYSMKGVWSGDVFTIGYGLEIKVHKDEYVHDGLDNIAIRLLTNHPNEYLHKARYRSLKFIFMNPIHRNWLLSKLFRLKKKTLREEIYKDTKAYDRPLWLTKTKCEVCNVCEMPNI